MSCLWEPFTAPFACFLSKLMSDVLYGLSLPEMEGKLGPPPALGIEERPPLPWCFCWSPSLGRDFLMSTA